MHELFVTKSIYQIAMKHALKNDVTRILSVSLEVGALSDLQNEWLQKYFDRLSRGTIAEGAKLNITRVPAIFRCNQCRRTFEIASLLESDLSCRQCHSKEVRLVSGNEYHVKNMEVQ